MKDRRLYYIIFIGIVGLMASLEAVGPRQWEFRSRDDFLKGKLDGLSLSSEGTLSLAPKEENLNGPAEDFYLSFLGGPDGTTFLGTGHGGKIYRIGKEGKAELYFQAPEMDVTCLARDAKGTLFAGTSPNGKVYKIAGKDQGEAFFNPDEKYIWDLAFDGDGSLLAAVGESGGIYRINPRGEGQRVLKAEENHVLCLLQGEKGNWYAGSGGVGVVYRLSAQGRAAVLFESPFEEVKSIALDGEGSILAGCGGTPSRTRKEEPAGAEVRVSTEVTVTASTAAQAGATAAPVSPLKEPGAVFRIQPDGTSRKLWESSDEMVYSLVWKEAEKRLVFGTGNKGRLYAIDKGDKVSLLVQGRSEQVYELIPADKKIYVLANNPSQLTALAEEQRLSGEYLSDVLDAKTISSWGRLSYAGGLPAGTAIQLQTRSGNSFEPNGMWSDWSPPIQKQEEQILSPKARYLQFKILFKTPSGNASPLVERVMLFYLQANVAPVIQKLELLPPNEVYLKPPDQEEIIWGAEESAAVGEKRTKERGALFLAKKAERKGYQTVLWESADENDDQLAFSISLKKDGEPAWRVVAEGWKDSLFVFDTLSFPDGTYLVKVEANDRSSNPPGAELKGEKVSPPLVIDNSLPIISGFSAVREGNGLNVAFQVEDSFSSIAEVAYLLRPGDWRVVFPTDGISDSKLETFKLRVPLPSGAENLISIRAVDRHRNVGVFRQVF
ncbi:MAG: WD40 repeat domain-containing protein [Acidobacteriota bacterium]